jgi:hypothetical protein
MASGWLSARGRVLARIGVGVLSRVLSAIAGERGGGDGLAREMLGVNFVLGLCLFSGEPYGEVLRLLVAGLEGPLAAAGWRAPVSRALTGARAAGR